MPYADPSIADRMQRKLNILVGLNVCTILALVIGWWVFAGKAAESHDALCNLRDAQERQVVQSETYLREHPEGAPKLGFSRADIEQQLARSRRTLKALDPLGCPPINPPVTVTSPVP